MDKNCFVKKGLTVGVIFLFIGVAFASSINANIFEESDLVEFTAEACGNPGAKHTVKLTKQQAEEVKTLFNSIRKRLIESDSRKETVEIFKEAVVDLDKFGLLGGLSVKQAQKLVTGSYQNMRTTKFLEKMYNNFQTSIEKNENWFCLIAGRTTNTFFEGRMSWFFWSFILWILENQIKFVPFFIIVVFLIFFALGTLQDIKSPIARGTRLGLGATYILDNLSANATGWVHTIGLNGVKRWNGSLQGNLPPRVRFCNYPKPGLFMVYQGAFGFRGIKIVFTEVKEIFYMGFATKVKISPDPMKS